MDRAQVRYISIVLWIVCSLGVYAYMAKGKADHDRPSKVLAAFIGLLISGFIFVVLFQAGDE